HEYPSSVDDEYPRLGPRGGQPVRVGPAVGRPADRLARHAANVSRWPAASPRARPRSAAGPGRRRPRAPTRVPVGQGGRGRCAGGGGGACGGAPRAGGGERAGRGGGGGGAGPGGGGGGGGGGGDQVDVGGPDGEGGVGGEVLRPAGDGGTPAGAGVAELQRG